MSENLTSSQILHRALSGNYTGRVPCICPGGMMNIMYAARRYGRGAQKGKLCRGLYEEGIVR